MSLLLLESDALSVSVNPRVGGTITGVRHRVSGLSVLGRVPWLTVDAPLPGAAARDEPEWLTRYTGGWPVLFPNAGDACSDGGIFHGFHGEASVAPWEVVHAGPSSLTLERRFAVIPARMQRVMTLSGETLSLREQVSFDGSTPIDVMWGHHPTFGSDLLDGPFEITSGALEVGIEPAYAPPAGADLARPRAPLACLAYLQRFDAFWAAIRRLDDAIAAVLTWDGTRFPCAWLWCELEGTADEPWAGRTRLVGIEPNTTACGLGIAEARRRGVPLLRLMPGRSVTGEIHLRVFRPSGPIASTQAARSS